MRITLVANRDRCGLRQFSDVPEILIGRDTECDFMLPDASVSRRHTCLRQAGSSWFAVDLGARHGTHVNSVRLDAGEEVELADGDFMKIGAYYVRVTLEGQPERPAASVRDQPSPATLDDGRGPDPLATRPSIFVRLRSDSTAVRELTWHEFSDRYEPIIRGASRKYGLHGEAADDIVQNVMLGFFRRVPDFDYDPSKGRFRSYLRTATVHQIFAALRSRKQDQRLLDGAARKPDDELALAWEWDKQYTRRLIERASALAQSEVEPNTWEAFDLFGRRDVPNDVVARELGMTEASVRKAKSNVAARFRAHLRRIQLEEE